MNVLSLFGGIECGQVALNRVGIPYDQVFASEIDKSAIATAQANFPNTIQLGDVKNWREWKLPKIDLLLAGFPCPSFSNAGKGLGFDDPRGEVAKNGKSSTLSSNSWEHNNFIAKRNYIQWDVSGKGYASQQDRAFYENGKHGTVPSCRTDNKVNVLLETGRIRRLTPIEVCRLQTVPTDYFYKDGKQIISDSAIYRCLGNCWTVDVIAWIFGFIGQELKNGKSQTNLF